MKIQIGKCKDNLFVILPKQTVVELGWNSGDLIDVDVIDGGLKASRAMTKHDHAMEIAHQITDEYRETFEALAKS